MNECIEGRVNEPHRWHGEGLSCAFYKIVLQRCLTFMRVIRTDVFPLCSAGFLV